jgi:osmotically-inducible protein OsmY
MPTVATGRLDEDIHRDVLAELSWEPRVLPNEVGVVVKDGVVTLTGWVDSFSKKWWAEQAAHRVRGVTAVANDIELRLPNSDERTDADIAAAVTRALDSDTSVPVRNLHVTVSKGWVTLRGDVDWHFQKTDAERAVRRLTGVQGVSNHIKLKPRPRPSPRALKQQIEDALVRSAETDAERITVEVNGGKVTLRGTVGSFVERREAERAAWSAPGVALVENLIVVRAN